MGDHGHDHHGHSHGAAHADDGDRRVGWAIIFNLGLTLAQLVGGVVSGSLALIADGIHNLSDALSFVIALAARRIGRRPADHNMTFGYARAETVAALVNYVTLILISIWLAAEGVSRLFSPHPINGWLVVIIAGIALVVDLATAVLTHRMAKTSMNIRAAYLHNLADALGSVGVMIAGAAMILWDAPLIDPIVTFGISGYILLHALREIGPVIRLLMLGSPGSPNVEDVLATMRGVAGVADVHHLYLWQVDESVMSVDAHVVIDDTAENRAEEIKTCIKTALAALGVTRVILELETAPHLCQDAPLIGRAMPQVA
jgi:cobalt-zinc-cadmium efflux system protein